MKYRKIVGQAGKKKGKEKTRFPFGNYMTSSGEKNPYTDKPPVTSNPEKPD